MERRARGLIGRGSPIVGRAADSGQSFQTFDLAPPL